MGIKYATNPDGTLDFDKYKAAIKNMMIQFQERSPGVVQLLGGLAEQQPTMGDPETAMMSRMSGGGDNSASSKIVSGSFKGDSGATYNWEDSGAKAAASGLETRARNLENMKMAAAPALAIINNLEKSWGEAFKDAPEKGLPLGYGVGKSIEAFGQTDTAVKSYLDTASAQMSLLVKGLGEKGVLTKQDVERVERAIPKQFTSKDLASRNFAAIRQTIMGGIQNYLNSGGDPSVLQGLMGGQGGGIQQGAPQQAAPQRTKTIGRFQVGY
jgi:hypothetical protein